MADTVEVAILKKIHSLLRQEADLSERLRKGPRMVQIAERNVQGCQAKREQLRESLQQSRMKADEKQLQLSERESHIEKLGTQRNSCESNREYQLLTDQIAADRKANEVLQDEILELYEKNDGIESEIAAAESDLQKLKADSKRIREKTTSEMQALQHDLAAVKGELEEAIATLPPAVRADFRRLRPTMGENVLATVEDQSCSNCCTVLSAQTHSQLMMSVPVFCSCGSLLYIPEKAPATR